MSTDFTGGYLPTDNTQLAAAFRALSVPVEVDNHLHLDAPKNGDRTTWQIHATSVEVPTIPFRPFIVGDILKLWNGGKEGNKLERDQPHHPFLSGYRAELILGRLLHGCMRSEACPGLTGYLLAPGPSEVSHLPNSKLVQIDDIDLACGLLLLGSQLARREGPAGRQLFTLTRATLPISLAPKTPPLSIPDVVPLILAWRDGSFAPAHPWHPLTRAIYARQNHRHLAAQIGKNRRVVMSRKIGKNVFAEFPETASSGLLSQFEKRVGPIF